MNIAYLFLVPAILVLMLTLPLWPVLRGVRTGAKAKRSILFNLCAFFAAAAMMVLLPAGNYIAYAAADSAVTGISAGSGLGYLAAAITSGLSAIGAGIAVASAAPAAIGAASEDPKSFGKSLIFVALGEGVALYGLLVAILIINNLA